MILLLIASAITLAVLVTATVLTERADSRIGQAVTDLEEQGPYDE